MPVEKVIKWNVADQIFEPVTIEVELVHTAGDVPIPMVADPPEIDPRDVIELIAEETTPTRARWRAKLAKSDLSPEDFYKKIEEPVTVTITVKPVASDTLSLVLAAPFSITNKCTVRVDPPKPKLHWRGPPFESDDARIEVEADGEHEIELHTWVERYIPRQGIVGHATETVEFSHKTEEGFDPRLFGPHPDDRPHIVAPAGGPNNREHSRWLSKASLPDPRFPSLTPPVNFSLRTKVWERGSITQRIPDDVRWKREALLEEQIPFVLSPIKLVAELLRPEEPFLAGDSTEKQPQGVPTRISLEEPFSTNSDEGVEAALKIWRARDHEPLKKGVISWEIKAETSLGGRVTPSQVTLSEADAGEAVFHYIPPKLTYKPNGRYREDLIVYHGEGANRQEIGLIPLLLRPAIKARIEVKKRGLTTKQAGVVDLAPAFSASEMKGQVKLTTSNRDPEEQRTEPACLASVDITIDGELVHGDIRTAELGDKSGEFTWKLPELDEVFVKLPDERVHELADAELPTLAFDDEAEGVIGLFEDKLRNYAPLTIVRDPLLHSLRAHRLDFGTHMAGRPEADYERIVSATDLLRTTTASASSWPSMYSNAFDRGVTDLCNFLSDFAGTLISVANIGPKLAESIVEAVKAVGPTAARIFQWMMGEFTVRLRWIGLQLLEAVTALGRQMPSYLSGMFESAAGLGKAAIDGLFAVFGLTDSQAWGAHLLAPLADALTNMFKFIGDVIWAIGTGLIWLAFRAVGPAFQGCATLLDTALDATIRVVSGIGGGLAQPDASAQFGFGKAMETAFTFLLQKTQLLKQLGTGGAATVQSQFSMFESLTRDAFETNHNVALKLAAPGAAAPAIDAYNATFRQVSETFREFIHTQIDIDMFGAALNLAVLLVELLFMLVSTITSGGLLTLATYGPVLTKIEILVGSVKSIVRLLQFGGSVAAGFAVQFLFHATTLKLME